jgi:uncharacterized protein (DUF3084 family)
MALAIQYDLLEQPEVSEVKADVAAQKESLRKIQKSLFAKMSDMSKMLFELYAQNEQLNQQYADALSMISSLVERLGKLEGKND